MLSHTFRRLAILLGWVALGACTQSQPPAAPVRGSGAAVVATFTGEYDPVTRAFTIRTEAQTDPDALTVVLPVQDGQPNTNPTDTFQLRTDSYGTDPSGCGTGVQSFWGDIELRSFFRTQSMTRVYAEIIDVPTDNIGCQNAPPVAGVSDGLGLWSYGTIGPAGSGSPSDRPIRRWHFRYVGDTPFTFHGRILAELGAPVRAGAPEFDWTPSQVVGSRSFQPVGTTMAHLVWNGSTFEDRLGTGITFQKVGAPTTTFSMVPGAPYASGLTQGNYFIADAAHGGNAIRTDGDFTVCARFKPGRHPYSEPLGSQQEKVLVAKGVAQGTGLDYEGWSLMQMHSGYCFHYRTLWDNTLGRGDVMAPWLPELSDFQAETFAYDYACGGRAGSNIWVGTTRGSGAGATEASAFANQGADLPLVIGAYADTTYPARDAGVYEVIFDERAPTAAVIQEILDAVERRLPIIPATYITTDTPTTYAAADGNSYVLPPRAVVPAAAADGSGSLASGRVLRYTRPLVEDTSTQGFCIGAEIQADGAWSNVAGGVLQYGGTLFKLQFGDGTGPGPWRWLWSAGDRISPGAQSGWADGSSHTVKVCVESEFVRFPPHITLYNDGALELDQTFVASIPNLSDGNALDIGTTGTGMVLTGARIRRVFACPGPDAASCN